MRKENRVVIRPLKIFIEILKDSIEKLEKADIKNIVAVVDETSKSFDSQKLDEASAKAERLVNELRKKYE